MVKQLADENSLDFALMSWRVTSQGLAVISPMYSTKIDLEDLVSS